MQRRDFLHSSISVAASVWSMSMLAACGGGGSETTAATLSSIDSVVADLQSAKATSDSIQSQSQDSQSATSFMTAFATTSVANSKATDFINQIMSDAKDTSLEIPHYLDDEDASVLEQYETYKSLSYTQFSHQYAKLLAALRVYGYKKDTAQQDLQTSLFASQTALVSSVDMSLLESAISLVASSLGSAALDAVTAILTKLKEVLLSKSGSDATIYALATFLSLDKLLETIKTKSLENLDFSNNESIIMSFVKMSIASMALLGSASLDKLQTSGTTETNIQLQIVSLQSKLILLLSGVVQSYVNSTIESMVTSMQTLQQLEASTTLTTEEQDMITQLQTELTNRSKFLAIIAMAFKTLFALSATSAIALQTDESNFQTDGDASQFWILFGNDALPQDEAFATYMETLESSLQADSDLSAIYDLISGLSTTFSTQADTFASDTESDAYLFASQLSQLSYNFTSQTETDAYNFATYLADLAYKFTMKIEDDAYTFAMQGMEYGYLFASQAEDIGQMADRILFMSVQIGQMADRIGEMADRIVYTEQLIVNTEILIQNFGLMIYGGMKTISNTMLMGLALVLDREWYSADGEDQIVTLIGETTQQMMEDMNTYALTVLENQTSLREITLSALDWVGE